MKQSGKIIIVVLLLALVASACSAGPHQLRRSVDDWDQSLYVDEPLVDGILWIIPVIPILQFVAAIGDWFITDAYYFWIVDVWEGEGTAFQHYQAKPNSHGSVKSLSYDDGKWLKASGAKK